MKCTIPEISWHNRDPVLSVDIQPVNNVDFYRLASGGTDCHVLIWYLKIRNSGRVDVDIVSDLTKHQRSVNVVRWSPTGQYLATGDDDANIIIWNLKTDNIPLLEGETNDKETWLVTKVLRGHREDVYDICWSPNGLKLLSGSIDNTAIIWDFNKGKNDHILSEHKGFVQGVSWDPKGDYIATLSSDRICRIYDSTGKSIKSKTYKGTLPVSNKHQLYNKEIKYFHDDTFKSYFRRLNFSPDGSFLIAPSGCMEADESQTSQHATFIFSLDSLAQPVAILPSPKQFTIVARCCPVLFELRSEGHDPLIVLPYRIVIAVGTLSDVVIYDTQQHAPFAHFQNIHYTRITDLTWSPDGLMLIASSTDGFCTLITFEPNELGVEYIKDCSENEESILDVSGCEDLEKTEASTSKEVVKVKKPSLLEKWAIRKPKDSENSNNKSEILTVVNKSKKETKTESNKTSNPIPCKRIAPTKIGEIEKKRIKLDTKDAIINTKKEMENKIIAIEDSSDKLGTKNEILTNTKKETDDKMIVIEDSSDKLDTKDEILTNTKKEMDDKIIVNEKSPVKLDTKNKTCINTKKETKDEIIVIEDSPLKKEVEIKQKNLIKTKPLLAYFQPIKNKQEKKETENVAKILIDGNDTVLKTNQNSEKESPKELEIVKSSPAIAQVENTKISNKTNLKENAVAAESSGSAPNKMVTKTIKRIPLITLSSPKSKKRSVE